MCIISFQNNNILFVIRIELIISKISNVYYCKKNIQQYSNIVVILTITVSLISIYNNMI